MPPNVSGETNLDGAPSRSSLRNAICRGRQFASPATKQPMSEIKEGGAQDSALAFKRLQWLDSAMDASVGGWPCLAISRSALDFRTWIPASLPGCHTSERK